MANQYAASYPSSFEIKGIFYDGLRKKPGNRILIPYSTAPAIKTGDLVKQCTDSEDLIFKVIDFEFEEGSTLKVGTKHPNLLTLTVENMTAASHQTPPPATYSIGAIHAEQVQVGSHNQLVTNITLNEVVKQVVEQGDKQARGLLLQLLENPTVSAIVGAGASIGFTKLLTG